MNTALNLPAPNCTNTTGGGTILVPPGQGPTHGTITQGTPNVYTPVAGYHGYDEFKYQLSDPVNGLSNAAMVRILVDSAPTCTNGSATVPMNGQIVLDNLPCSDPDGAADYSIGATDGDHGFVDFLDDRVVTYTPVRGFVGTDVFTIAAEDVFGLQSADARTTITVVAPPPPPAATPVPTVVPKPVATAAPKDLSAPAVTLKNASKKQAVAITLSANEHASALLTLTLAKATAKKLKLSRTVGTRKAALVSGKASTVSIKLTSKARKALKKLKRVKLTLTAVVADAAGNTTTKTLRITLKR